MSRTLFTSILAIAMTSWLLAACADDRTETDSTAQAEPAAAGTTESVKVDSDSLMNQPVDFSSPEAAEKTLQNIREVEGEKAYKNLKSAMDYIMFYDLSVGKDKEKLYKKLDGKTPNQIFAKMRR